MALLNVNIDHVATLRQARGGDQPDPVWAAAEALLAGAAGITLHVREDRRHVQDRDARLIRPIVHGKYNLEMAATDAMVTLAAELQPDQVTLVPEKREELTTEGGLDVVADRDRLAGVVERLHGIGTVVSMFVDPDARQIDASEAVGADAVELHTGSYAEAFGADGPDEGLLDELKQAADRAADAGLVVHAGHGLDYLNVGPVAGLPHLVELNIGHAIVSRAVFVGLREAVERMIDEMHV